MKKYLICGVSDIGVALAAALQQDRSNEVVFISRQSHDIGAHCEVIDLTQSSCVDDIEILMKSYSFDVVVNTIGSLSVNGIAPEKTIVSCDDVTMLNSIKVNMLPTLHIAQAMSRAYHRHDAFVFASFSARLSSMSDNRLGGWYSYRIAKASLNALIKNLANEWKVKFPKAKVFGYHPGTVNTKLTRPWLASVDPSSVLTTSQAANYFIQYLNNHQVSDNGHLFDWKQKRVEF